MQGRALRDRRAWAIAAGLAAAALLAVAPAVARAETTIQAASTVDGSELVKTVPIHRQAKHGKVVLSLGSGSLPALAAGDTLRASAMLQVSTTCATPDPRCIGVRYDYSPNFSAQLVLGDGAGATHGAGVVAVTPRFQMGCGQKRPNRNHHCVLALPGTPMTIPGPDQLPCLTSGCSLNLVVDAYNTNAKTGNVLVIGNDQPDGTVKGGRSRVNAIVIPPGQGASPTSAVTTTPATASIPIGQQRSGFSSVVFSARLDGLAAGDVLDVNSLQRTDISSFNLPMFVGSKVVVAAAPNGVMGQKKYSSEEGQVTPQNGFNCTLGPSPFQTPCSSYETGVVTITQTPVTNAGLPKPLYVNVLSRSFPKVAQAAHARSVAVQAGGYLSVVRYPAISP
jgi:hypothetical protein